MPRRPASRPVYSRITDDGVVIDKAPAEGDDPFAAFDEWGGEHDESAYGDL